MDCARLWEGDYNVPRSDVAGPLTRRPIPRDTTSDLSYVDDVVGKRQRTYQITLLTVTTRSLRLGCIDESAEVDDSQGKFT
jgi:hypothetical protein